MYDNPTLCQRLGVGKAREVQFAYQKAESRFDNYSIRAIIRDERFWMVIIVDHNDIHSNIAFVMETALERTTITYIQ